MTKFYNLKALSVAAKQPTNQSPHDVFFYHYDYSLSQILTSVALIMAAVCRLVIIYLVSFSVPVRQGTYLLGATVSVRMIHLEINR